MLRRNKQVGLLLQMVDNRSDKNSARPMGRLEDTHRNCRGGDIGITERVAQFRTRLFHMRGVLWCQAGDVTIRDWTTTSVTVLIVVKSEVKPMKCKYCGTTVGVEELGVSGKYDRVWRYCPEHEGDATSDRDSFLKEKIGKTFEEVITPPLYVNEKAVDE